MKKPMMKMHGPAVISSLLFAVLLIAFPFHSIAQNQKSFANYERLWQKVGSEGNVMVIVRLDVPRIKELTAASAKFWGADANQAITLDRTYADTALSDAIEDAAWKLLAELQGTDYTVNANYRSIPFMALRVSANSLALLEASPAVLAVEEDVPIRLIEPVPGAVSGKGEKLPARRGDLSRPLLDTSVDLIGAKTAWSWGYTGAGWYVAVLDTGIRRTHQFFSGKTIVEACFARGSDGVGPAGDCPNRKTSMTGIGSAIHHPRDYSGYDHGTHVTGIATGNHGSLAGVAKDASIIAVQVFSKFSASQCGDSSPCVMSWNSDTLSGLDYIYSIRGSYNIASVNMSLGGGAYYSPCDSDSRKAAIDNLRSVGIATPIATGNDGSCFSVSAPACISTSVAVGSSTDSDDESYFNNWDETMQKLFAPGSDIYSSTGDSDTSYDSWSGTSMATPHVAGAWALLKQAIPNGSVTKFLNALRSTGVPVTSYCDGNNAPIPRIQVDRAIASLVTFTLTIQSSHHGTTNPSPGIYHYAPGTELQISAVPDLYCIFINWIGSATGSTNPLSLTMDSDKSVSVNFRFIYAPSATGRKVLNRSFSQADYIDILSWQANPANQGLDITKYRIYKMSGSTPSLLVELTADKFEYYQHKAGRTSNQYAIVAVTSSGREGAPALVTVQ